MTVLYVLVLIDYSITEWLWFIEKGVDDTLNSNRRGLRGTLQPAFPEVDKRLPHLILAIEVRVAHTDECAREVSLCGVSWSTPV
jgi:hypothetical protein